MLPIISTKDGDNATHIYINGIKTNLWWWNSSCKYYNESESKHEETIIRNFCKLIETGKIKDIDWDRFDTCNHFDFEPKEFIFKDFQKVYSLDEITEAKKDLPRIPLSSLQTPGQYNIKDLSTDVPKVFKFAQYCNCLNKDQSKLLPNCTVLIYAFGISFYASN